MGSKGTALRRGRKPDTSSLEATFDIIGALIVVLDAEGVIVRFNRACEQATGYRAEEVIGKAIWDLLLPPEAAQLIRGVFDELVAGQFPNRHRNAWVTRTGDHRMIEWANTALVDDTGAVTNVIGTGIDVTDRLDAERRQQDLQSELSHLARLSEMGQMASVLAHEISQPLTAAKNYLRAGHKMLAGEGGASFGKAAAVLDEAVTQVDRASEIVRQLREFTRKARGGQRAEDLRPVIDEAKALAFMGSKDMGIAVLLISPPDLPRVRIDKILIGQVLVNLIRNAIEAMERSETRELTIKAARSGPEEVEVNVTDTGRGIASDIAERLFQPFVTSKSQGIGLGLSLSRTIVESHGGRLWTEANPLGGTVFRFTLPVAS